MTSKQNDQNHDPDPPERKSLHCETMPGEEDAARCASMPLRRMLWIKVSPNNPTDISRDLWELECGHFVSRGLPLGDGGSAHCPVAHCPVCYAIGMHRAKKMLEQG